MKSFLSELLRFAHRFGLIKGVYLYGRIKVGKQEDITVPGILHPLTLRKNTSDYETFYQAIVHNQYQFNYGIKPKIIIDGGANIGLASIAFKNSYPDALIIAVEPDNENYTLLQDNIKEYTDIHTIQAGLWNKKAFLKVSDKYNLGKWGMITEEVPQQGDGTIDTVTISEIIQKFNLERIDILKLDIETAERELFSAGFESWLPKVKIIVIELHDSITSGTAKPFFTAINKTFKNYRFFQLGENTIIINEDLAINPV